MGLSFWFPLRKYQRGVPTPNFAATVAEPKDITGQILVLLTDSRSPPKVFCFYNRQFAVSSQVFEPWGSVRSIVIPGKADQEAFHCLTGRAEHPSGCPKGSFLSPSVTFCVSVHKSNSFLMIWIAALPLQNLACKFHELMVLTGSNMRFLPFPAVPFSISSF